MCLMLNTKSLWGQVLLAEGPEKLLNIGWCHGKLRLDDCCWNKTLRISCLVKVEQDCSNKHSKQWHHGNQLEEKFSLIILISSNALFADIMSCSKQQKSYKTRHRNSFASPFTFRCIIYHLWSKVQQYLISPVMVIFMALQSFAATLKCTRSAVSVNQLL